MKTRSAVKKKKAQQPAQAPAEVSRAPLPSSSAKSESTLSVRQARALRALAQASSSSSGVSVVLENEDINYVPIDGKVEIKYKVRPAGVTVSAKLSLQTGSGDATFEDGSKSQDIKDEGTLILLGATISSDVDNIRLKALSTERKLTVIDCVVQAKQTIGGQSIWRPEEEGESIDNLLAV